MQVFGNTQENIYLTNSILPQICFITFKITIRTKNSFTYITLQDPARETILKPQFSHISPVSTPSK